MLKTLFENRKIQCSSKVHSNLLEYQLYLVRFLT